MAPEALVSGGRRSAVVPPHDKRALRKARGLEAAVVDKAVMTIPSLDQADSRTVQGWIAGPPALIVAKVCKVMDRLASGRHNDKDAHDVYRLLVAVPTEDLVAGFRRLAEDPVSASVTHTAIDEMSHRLRRPNDLFCEMAGRAELDVGYPEQVQQSTSMLASDLLAAIEGL